MVWQVKYLALSLQWLDCYYSVGLIPARGTSPCCRCSQKKKKKKKKKKTFLKNGMVKREVRKKSPTVYVQKVPLQSPRSSI